MKRYTLWPLVLFTLLVGCRHADTGDANTKDAPPMPAIQVVPVTRATLERALPVTGTLMALPTQEATVSPPVAGILDGLFVRYGQTVVKGQVIAHLSTRALTGQIEQAQATIGQNQLQVQQAEANALQQQAQTRTAILQAAAAERNAEANLASAQATLIGDEATLHNAEQSLARAKTLYADGLIAQKDVESAQLAVRTAQAQVEAQRQMIDGQRQTVAGQKQALAAAKAAGLQDIVKRKDIQVARQQVRNAQGALKTAQSQRALYTLRAPLSGQITAVGANLGETVDTTTKIASIANLSRLQLQLAVPAASAPEVHPGARVTFTTEALPGRTLQTTIVRVASQADPQTGTIPAFAVVANPGALKDDTTVQAQIVIERRADVLTIPKSALLTDPDTGETSVVVVSTDEVAHVKPVTVGLTQGGDVEITKGLSEGQKIAVSGQYGLPDGAKVSVRNGP